MKKILLLALSIIFIAAACNKPVVKQKSNQSSEQTAADMMKDKNGMNKDEAMMPKGSQDAMHKDSMMAKHGSYKDYSAAEVLAEQAAGQKVVLYFYAPWCPFCRAADADFKANPDKIPAGVTVLKTLYDSETALKQKYGVTYQHTFVQIDNNGNQVTKWVSGDTGFLVKNVK